MSTIKKLPTPGKNPLNNHIIDASQFKQKNGSLCADVNLPTCHLVILSPSFGCPGIFAKDEKIVLYVLADFNFYSVHQDKEEPDCLAERVINYHLKINKWKDGQQQKENSCIKDELLYAKGTAAGHITCTLLDYLHETKVEMPSGKTGTRTVTLPPERRIYSDEGKKDLIACIRDSTRDYYLRRNQKTPNPKDKPQPPAEPDQLKQRPDLPFLYKIELDTEGMQSNAKPVLDTLYDVAWFIVTEKRNAIEFGELQDLACEYVACDKSRELKPTKLFKVKDGKVDFSSFDEKSSIQAYHPFTISSKDHLNLGQLSDVHISARQAAFRQSPVHVFERGVEGAEGVLDKCKEPIGKIFNSSLESFSDMLIQMAQDKNLDAIVITGDLVDHAYNFNPNRDCSKVGTLWTYMNRSDPKNDSLYQPYIDNLAVLSLFKYCYDTYQKPIFLISGNHDNYKDIFGISPRVGSTKGALRGNSGLAADHNLTIFEACLMYGPAYHEYFKGNFQSPYADWFYHLFTPLTDYRVTYKDQCIVGLGWGDDEDIMNTGVFSADFTLYRSSESISDEQLELLNAAAQKGTQRVVCTHYPFVSYDVGLGITSNGSVNCNDVLETVDLYSQGTFKKNRAEAYQMLQDKQFHYTLSGHSHRSGLYSGDLKHQMGRKNYEVTGKEIPLSPMPLKTQSCNMIVSGCSGPVGVQNNYESLDTGLGSFGLDYPSGNHITLTPGSEKIKRVIPQDSTAKPRFAVSMDYLDIMGREVSLGTLGKIVGSQNMADQEGKAGAFTSIESNADGTSYTFTLNPKLPKQQFIKSIHIVMYDAAPNNFKAYKLDVSPTVGSGVMGVLDGKKANNFKESVLATSGKKTPTFLAITFNDSLSGTQGYTQYNFDSPWTYPIEFIDKKIVVEQALRRERELDNYQIAREVALVNGYVIRRHPDNGELPDFGWYNKTFDFKYPGKIK